MFRIIAGLWLLFGVPIFLLMSANLLGTISRALFNEDGRPQTVALSGFTIADTKGAHQEFQVRGWYTGIEGTVVTDRSKGWTNSYLIVSSGADGLHGPHIVFVFHDEDLNVLRNTLGPKGTQVLAAGFVDAWVRHEKEVTRDLAQKGIDLQGDLYWAYPVITTRGAALRFIWTADVVVVLFLAVGIGVFGSALYLTRRGQANGA